MFTYERRWVLKARLQRRSNIFRWCSVAQRDGNVSQPTLVSDASDGATGKVLLEFLRIPRKKIDKFRRIQPLTHRKIGVAEVSKTIPRAADLAVVAAVDSIANEGAQFKRNRAVKFNGQIGNAAPCVDLVGCDDGSSWAGLDAAGAGAAVAVVGRVHG